MSQQPELFMRAGGKQSSALAVMVCKELLWTKPINTSNRINKLIMEGGAGSIIMMYQCNAPWKNIGFLECKSQALPPNPSHQEEKNKQTNKHPTNTKPHTITTEPSCCEMLGE